MYIKLEDLEVYKLAMEIAEEIWGVVNKWEAFKKYSLGNQITRSADSMGLNLAEGYGRFHFKENKNFCYYARGSAFETKTALLKAYQRKLVSEETYNALIIKMERFLYILNQYIKSIGTTK